MPLDTDSSAPERARAHWAAMAHPTPERSPVSLLPASEAVKAAGVVSNPAKQAALGRVVIAHGLAAATNNGSTVAPAIITRAWTETEPGVWTVNAKVFLDAIGDRWLTSVHLFDEDLVDPRAWLEGRGYVLAYCVYLTWPAR